MIESVVLKKEFHGGTENIATLIIRIKLNENEGLKELPNIGDKVDIKW